MREASTDRHGFIVPAGVHANMAWDESSKDLQRLKKWRAMLGASCALHATMRARSWPGMQAADTVTTKTSAGCHTVTCVPGMLTDMSCVHMGGRLLLPPHTRLLPRTQVCACLNLIMRGRCSWLSWGDAGCCILAAWLST